jgi:hypothetical protein
MAFTLFNDRRMTNSGSTLSVQALWSSYMVWLVFAPGPCRKRSLKLGAPAAAPSLAASNSILMGLAVLLPLGLGASSLTERCWTSMQTKGSMPDSSTTTSA